MAEVVTYSFPPARCHVLFTASDPMSLLFVAKSDHSLNTREL